MKGTVFYSWQADNEEKVCRYLVRDALQEALKDLSESLTLDEATRGEPGSPEIFGIILKKLAKASFAVIDLSIVGNYSDKSTSNPNVLIEYGYALSELSDQRIISVLNDHFGDPEQLPFDLRARAIRVRYNLSPDATSERRKEVERQVAGRLRSELQLAIDSSLWHGISESGRLAIELFITKSEHGMRRDPQYSFADFCSLLSLSDSDAKATIEDLEHLTLIESQAGMGNSHLSVFPCNKLFWMFDWIFKDWSIEADATFVANKLISGPKTEQNQLVSVRLAEELGWPTRRINPALTFLADNDYVEQSKSSAYPFAVYSIIETANTRRFVKELPAK